MSFFTRSLILFVLFFSFANYKAGATIRYVKAVATGTGTGASWTDATADLQGMINASASGDEVWVAAGRYTPTRDPFGSASPSDARSKTFLLKDGVKLYGGFAGNETLLSQRPATAAGSISILSGDFSNNDVLTGVSGTLGITNYGENAYHVLLAVNTGNTTILDGFTISGGCADIASTVTVGGRYTNTSYGGGMMNSFSSLVINNCEFKGNFAANNGGAIESYASFCNISNTVIYKNYSNSYGGAIFYEATSGGQLQNLILWGNKTGSTGTVFSYNTSTPAFTNCTFYDNYAGSQAATSFTNNSTPTFKNCILWNPNNTVSDVQDYSGGNTVVTYSIVKGTGGTGNTILDPGFLNAALPEGADGIFRTADDGLQLTHCGAAYNAGTNSGAAATDILGIARPQFSTADMGAFESTTALNAPANPALAVTAFSCTSTTLQASGAATYLWSGGATPTAAENIFTINGTYTLTGYTALGCSTTISTTVALAPTISFTGATTACQAAVITATGAVSYVWDNGNTPAAATNTFTQSGTYSVTATAANSCVSTASVTVTVIRVPVAYVDGGVAASGDGSSWATAFKTIQEAINVCGIQQVWVKAGTYLPAQDADGNTTSGNRDKAFYLKNGLKLYGGFAGTETLLSQRNVKANATILSGDMLGDDVGFTNNTENVHHVIVSVSNDTTAIVDGFTIRGGNANGAGSYIVNSKSINRTVGAGMNMNVSGALVRNCVFIGNKATNGGGMHNTTCTAAISNCIFTGNTTTSNGGGMFNTGNSVLTISNCSFSSNAATQGGGMYNVSSSKPTISNCTFSANTSTTNGAGITNASSSVATIQNSISWGNTGTGANLGIYNNGGSSAVSYSDVQGTGTFAGTGNVNGTPAFINGSSPAGADGIFGTADDGLALQNTSNLLDAGAGATAPALDILGNSTFNLTRDMGAYEQQEGQAVYSSTPACQTISISSVQGNQWFYFRNASGIIAAINPNGSNLGTVTASINDATGAINYNAKNYVGRSVDFTCSNYAAGVTIPAAYSIRLYYYDTELAEFNTAASTANTINNMGMDWFQGGTGCDITTYAGNTTGNIATADIISGDYGAAGNGFFLQFNLDHFTIFAPTAPAVVLPLNLLSFTGVTSAAGNNLKWEAANEVNSKNFIIERSFDGRAFTAIAAQNANAAGNYFYTDAASNIQAQAISYYRLKMVDNNGRYTYSNVIRLTITPGSGISVYPNPVTDKATLYIPGRMLLNVTIKLCDLNGKLIKTFTAKQNFETIDMSGLPAGVYLLQTSTGETLKVIKA